MAGSGDQEIGMITERLRKSTSWWSSPFIRKRAIAPHLFYTGQCNLPLSFELLQSKETAYQNAGLCSNRGSGVLEPVYSPVMAGD